MGNETPDPSRVCLILPVLNERAALPLVLGDLPPTPALDVIVVDNGSTDGSGDVAKALGARVVHEPRRGYGSACLAGIAAAANADVIAFLDADYSDHPEQIARLLAPLLRGEADLVVGSRMLGDREPGALPVHARFGNRLAVTLIRALWGVRYTDLGPFRAIRADALERIEMTDRGYGWTVEMQVKAAACGLRVREVPVDYRNRVGRSKITGTVRGTIAAGTKILATIFRLRMSVGRRIAPAPQSEKSESERRRVTIVVPVLGESAHLADCLDALLRLEGPIEIIVCDGGSDDGTLEIAERCERVRLIRTRPGRGFQMNAGAARASGEILWFLHADCIAPAGSASAVRRALDDPRVALGAFRFRLAGDRAFYRLIERAVALRVRVTRLPFGDQGLFMRRRDFESVSGFPDDPLLEDVALAQRMRRRGRLKVLKQTLPTSPRRWEANGLWRTTFRNTAALVLGAAGVDRASIRRYRDGEGWPWSNGTGRARGIR